MACQLLWNKFVRCLRVGYCLPNRFFEKQKGMLYTHKAQILKSDCGNIRQFLAFDCNIITKQLLLYLTFSYEQTLLVLKYMLDCEISLLDASNNWVYFSIVWTVSIRNSHRYKNPWKICVYEYIAVCLGKLIWNQNYTMVIRPSLSNDSLFW